MEFIVAVGWLLAGLLLVLLLLGWLQRRRQRSQVPDDIPGPPGLPILGNTLLMLRNKERLLEWQHELTQTYGATWKFSFIGQPLRIYTTDPVIVEHILKGNFPNYEKGDVFKSRFHDLLGDGIFNIDGDLWYQQRKTASNMFNIKNFRDNMCGVFVDHGKQVLKLLDGVKNGQSINMHDVFHRYTLDSIGSIAFGYDINSIEDPGNEFARAFDYCQIITYNRFVTPLAGIWKVRKLYAAEEFEFSRRLKILDDKAYEVIKHRREEIARNPNLERYDLLTLFMDRRNSDGKEFSDAYLRDVIMNFIIAGRDTTAQNLSWTFYLVSQNKEVEDKLIKEVDEVFGDELPSFHDIEQLKYAQAVILESLRLFPSVPKDVKYSVKDDVLPNGMHIPKGAFVGYHPYSMGRSVDLWGKDAAEFRPDRWLEEGATFKPSPFKFTAFQGGPRTCLGQNMAYLEAKTMMVMILQKYRLRLAPGQNITYQNGVTLPMRNSSLEMIPIPREKK